METFLTGWPDMPELHFDAATQTLTLVYRSGDTRHLAPVTRDGLDRFLDGEHSAAVLAATAGTRWIGMAGAIRAVVQRGRALLQLPSTDYRGVK